MKNKESGFIIPLILAIVAIVAVGSGVYVYQENKKVETPISVMGTDIQTSIQTKKTTAPKPTEVSQQNKVNTFTSVSNDSSKELGDWKIYQNSKFKMQIAYPPTFDVKESEIDCGSPSLLEECPVYLSPRSGYGLVGDRLKFTLYYSDPSEVRTSDIDKFIYGIHAWTIFQDNLPSLKPIMIDKFPAFISAYTYKGDDGKNVTMDLIYVKKDNLVIQFIYNQKSKVDSQDIADLVKKMILTLK